MRELCRMIWDILKIIVSRPPELPPRTVEPYRGPCSPPMCKWDSATHISKTTPYTVHQVLPVARKMWESRLLPTQSHIATVAIFDYCKERNYDPYALSSYIQQYMCHGTNPNATVRHWLTINPEFYREANHAEGV